MTTVALTIRIPRELKDAAQAHENSRAARQGGRASLNRWIEDAMRAAMHPNDKAYLEALEWIEHHTQCALTRVRVRRVLAGK